MKKKKSKGKKFDGAKPRVDLIPVEFEIMLARAFQFGVSKYGEHNYREGILFQKLLAAAKRHTLLELAGVKIDDESKLPHWALAGASLAMYAFMKYNRPEMDNRYKYTEKQLKQIVKLMYGDE